MIGKKAKIKLYALMEVGGNAYLQVSDQAAWFPSLAVCNDIHRAMLKVINLSHTDLPAVTKN